jgi:hypothetical protein
LLPSQLPGRQAKAGDVTLEYCSWDGGDYPFGEFDRDASGERVHYPGGDRTKKSHRADLVPPPPTVGSPVGGDLGGIRYRPETFGLDE